MLLVEIARHQKDVLDAAMQASLNQLDQVVGLALGLDPGDIAEIQNDLCSDPFLKGIRPRYPGTTTRKQGFRSGLDSDARYS